ncbi:MAG: hypothetical protein HN580_27355 [Deltaproteobacteria bacterium]|jgi:hypothetical protein|nr:hypothetical protein [Candidatus Falkowbacteria bacterium]MBT7007322.1 hypothetical protein [Candidatus Falkowbacteria bacterium]MBT7892757.1 hypothetical protein [Deltaproteobacteria bacterium]
MTKRTLKIANRCAQYLAHGCAVYDQDDFESIEALVEAMQQAADEDNEGCPDLAFAKPWQPDRYDHGLEHSTGSFRMRIMVDEHMIMFKLFTPGFGEGEQAFLTVTYREEGNEIHFDFPDEARVLIGTKPFRIDHVRGLIVPILEEVLDISFFDMAMPVWLEQAVCQRGMASAQESIDYYSRPDNGNASKEELVASARKAHAMWQKRYEFSTERYGKLF